jgi:hypothetical protein
MTTFANELLPFLHVAIGGSNSSEEVFRPRISQIPQMKATHQSIRFVIKLALVAFIAA